MKIFLNGEELVWDERTTTTDGKVEQMLAAWFCDTTYAWDTPGTSWYTLNTSGTTGHAKRISHSRETIEQCVASNADLLGLHRDSRIYATYAPQGIAYAVLAVYLGVWCGCTVYIDSYRGLGTVARLNEVRPTHTLILPNIWKQLHRHHTWDSLELASVDTCLTGSDFTPQGMLEDLRAHGARQVWNVYGSTEVPPIVLCSEWENEYSLESVPAGAQVKITDGEIWARWTTQTSWWRSGDLVEPTARGFLLRGRQLNMFKQDAHRVYPEQVEKCAVAAGATIALCQQVDTQCVVYYEGTCDVELLQQNLRHIPRVRIQQVDAIELDQNLKKVVRTQRFV